MGVDHRHRRNAHPLSDTFSFIGRSRGAVFVTHPDRAAFLDDIEARLREKRGFSVATVNLDHLVKLRRDRRFLDAYRAQTHVVADGNPIVWLSRLAGRGVELVPGSELIAPLSKIAARLETPVALLGATEETLAHAAAALEADHPGLRVVCRIAPAQGFDPDGAAADAALEELGASGARLCFLALGAPKQERLAARGLDRLPECGFVSIGAGLDFIAGTQVRAPRLARRLALEWLWRLGRNPRRLAARYGACIAILPGLAAKAVSERGQGR